jgi:hypothetical protein
MSDQKKFIVIDENGNPVEQPVEKIRQKHEWGPSRLNHGEAQCIHCFMTNREAWVLGEYCFK